MKHSEIRLTKVSPKKILSIQPNAFCLSAVYRFLIESYPSGEHYICIPNSFLEEDLLFQYSTQNKRSSLNEQAHIKSSLAKCCQYDYLLYDASSRKYFFTKKAWNIFEKINSSPRTVKL